MNPTEFRPSSVTLVSPSMLPPQERQPIINGQTPQHLRVSGEKGDQLLLPRVDCKFTSRNPFRVSSPSTTRLLRVRSAKLPPRWKPAQRLSQGPLRPFPHPLGGAVIPHPSLAPERSGILLVHVVPATSRWIFSSSHRRNGVFAVLCMDPESAAFFFSGEKSNKDVKAHWLSIVRPESRYGRA